MATIVHKYMERGSGGFANVTMPDGRRIFISLAVSGIQIFKLILGGKLPWGSLFKADAAGLDRIGRVLSAERDGLPELPNDAAMDALLTGATKALTDPDIFTRGPSEDGYLPISNLQLVTRAALAEPNTEAFLRRLQRAAATPYPGR